MKMASSIVSSMFVSILLLLLVFPHLDKANGAQMEFRKLSVAGAEETNNPDQVWDQKWSIDLFRPIIERFWNKFNRCKVEACRRVDFNPPPLPSREPKLPPWLLQCLKNPKCPLCLKSPTCVACHKNPKCADKIRRYKPARSP